MFAQDGMPFTSLYLVDTGESTSKKVSGLTVWVLVSGVCAYEHIRPVALPTCTQDWKEGRYVSLSSRAVTIALKW